MCNKFNYINGGTERYLFDLREGLGFLGHNVFDFAMSDARNAESIYSDYFVSYRNFGQHKFNPNSFKTALAVIYSLEARNNIELLINKYKPEVAHLHNIYYHLSTSILKALRKHKIPIVMTLHDYNLICPNHSLFTNNKPCVRCVGGYYYHSVLNRCVKKSYLASFLACCEMYYCKLLNMYKDNIDLFIAPSVFLRNIMIRSGIGKGKIYYLPYAINLDDFKPNFVNGSYVLYLGRITRKKGIFGILESAKVNKGIIFKIAGDGEDLNSCRNYAKKKKLVNVEFLGYLDRAALLTYIRNASFVVVPSLWYEVLGLVIYEAFASGKCVLGANIGGIPELVENGKTGLLFESGSPSDLAVKTDYLIRNPDYAITLGKNGLAKIKKISDQNAHLETILGLYSRCINNYSKYRG
ncbi:MAG: glycosyltransferase [Candidatus Omnitrophota bacterium]